MVSYRGLTCWGALEDNVRDVVVNYEEHMLQDADVWTHISRHAQRLVPYDDPQLRSRGKYLEFLQQLHDRGILGFTQDCRGRVGAFTVAKKPKVVEGVSKPRQRLVLDCRQTNMMFRPSPHCQLGSLASLCDLELGDDQCLYTAGSDIRDCFYAVRLPEGLEQFFVLREDVTFEEAQWVTRYDGSISIDMKRFCPAIIVLPMGFSWSFYLVQHIHEQSVLRSLGITRDELILEGRPVPTILNNGVCSLPYCDNVHTLSPNKEICSNSKQSIVDDLEDLGFELHEDEPASLEFETLGGVIDGFRGEIRPTSRRAWRIKLAFEYITTIPVSSKTVEKLIGHGVFLSILNRSGMSAFRALYDFVDRNKTSGGRHWLNGREIEECKTFSGLIPMLYSSLRRHWSPTVTCTDASPDGYGIVETHIASEEVSDLARWHEKWRFRRLPPEQWNPRRRALGADVVADPISVIGVDEEDRLLEQYVVDEDFPEVPHHFLQPEHWDTKLMGKWNNTKEHITVKEGRALVLAFRRLCRSSKSRGQRHLFFCDNLALVFSANKGRAHSFDMLRIIQQLSALSLVGGFSYRLRWVPSELNNADGPSRGQVDPGPYRKASSGANDTKGTTEEPGKTNDRCQKVADSEKSRVETSASEANPCGEAKQLCQAQPAFAEEKSDKAASLARSGSWQASPAGEDDPFGREVSQCRSPKSVPEILGNFREFLPNFRSKLAPRRSDRPRLGGLLGRNVCRGQIIERGRKSSGSCGVSLSPTKGVTCSQPQSLERVEEREASPISATIASAAGEWNGHAADGAAQAAESDQTPCRPRYVPSTWREYRAERKGPRSANSGEWKTVPTLQHSGQRCRDREARQGGCFRQQCSAELSREKFCTRECIS